MPLDRELIDNIKSNFVRKSSAQLVEIINSNDHVRWSPEAFAAAQEILQERSAGIGRDPLMSEDEPPQPPHYDLNLVALGALSALVTGVGFVPGPTAQATDPNPARAVSFGSNIAWLALDTVNTQAVASVLGLQNARPATWGAGIAGAYSSSVFVTPALGEWTLAVGTPLFPPDAAAAFIKPLLERLSKTFGEAQYFCTHRDAQVHIWARARRGNLVRGFGWHGRSDTTFWNEGAPTKHELGLGFAFVNHTPAAQGARTVPDENCVMELACLWSIDPTAVEMVFNDPELGLVGKTPSI